VPRCVIRVKCFPLFNNFALNALVEIFLLFAVKGEDGLVDDGGTGELFKVGAHLFHAAMKEGGSDEGVHVGWVKQFKWVITHQGKEDPQVFDGVYDWSCGDAPGSCPIYLFYVGKEAPVDVVDAVSLVQTNAAPVALKQGTPPRQLLIVGDVKEGAHAKEGGGLFPDIPVDFENIEPALFCVGHPLRNDCFGAKEESVKAFVAGQGGVSDKP